MQIHKTVRRSVLLSSAIFSTLLPTLTHAEAQNSADSSAERAPEVIVTAQKRSQNVQNVPIAVTALGADAVKKFGIVSVSDLRGVVPSLEIRRGTAFGNLDISIRGVGSTNFDTISSAVVTTYFDDVPTVSNAQLNFTTFDLQSIEVLKGPQGTLFGSGTTAGVVLFNSVRPTKTFQGYVQASAGDYGSGSLEGAVSGPIAPGLYARISARGEAFGGYYTNLATGGHVGGHDAGQVRGQILWESGPSTLLAHVQYQNTQGSAGLYDDIPLLSNNGSGIAQQCPVIQTAINRGKLTQSAVNAARTQCLDIYGSSQTTGEGPYKSYDLNAYNNNIPIKGEQLSFGIRDDYSLGDKTLTSITGLDHTRHGGVDPEGPGEAPGRSGATDVYWVTHVLAFSQEVRLSSNSSAATSWVAGFNFLANRISNELNSQFTYASFDDVGSPFISEAPGATQFSPAEVAYSAPQTQTDVEAGVFAQFDWKLTDKLTLVTGLREGWYKKDGSKSASPDLFSNVSNSINQFGTSYNAGLNYKFSPDVLLYAKIAQGVKAGSYNGGFIFSAAAAVPAKQETLRDYEIGLKSEYFDKTLQFNLALFNYDYYQLQSLTQRVVGDELIQQYTNIGNANVKGAEADIKWYPTNNLTFGLGGTYLYTDVFFTNDGIYENMDGHKLANAPKYSANWLASYKIDVPGGSRVTLQYNGNYSAGQYRLVDNDALDYDPGIVKHNVNVTWLSADRDWELSAWAKNITNALDFTWQFEFGGVSHRSYMAPRTFGATMTKRFG